MALTTRPRACSGSDPGATRWRRPSNPGRIGIWQASRELRDAGGASSSVSISSSGGGSSAQSQSSST